MMPSLRIIVPFHNAAPWIRRCLESIRRQTVAGWTCHLANDCSTDGSSDIARRMVTQDSRFQLTSNPRRLYQCGSFQRILSSAEFCSNDICVSVDADDFLADESVLTRVMDAYADGTTWLTWGNHLWTDGSPGIWKTLGTHHVSCRHGKDRQNGSGESDLISRIHMMSVRRTA